MGVVSGPAGRMSAADAAWLGLDRPEHLMVVTAVLRLGRRLELDALLPVVRDRLVAPYPRFRGHPVRPRLPLVPPTWRDDPDFDLSRHLRSVVLDVDPGGADQVVEQALMSYVSAAMSVPLDRNHPMWTLTLVHTGSDRTTVVARLHHSLADGIALAGVLLSLVDEASAPVRPPVTEPAQPEIGRPAGPATDPAPRSGSTVGTVRTVAVTAARTVSKVLVGRSEEQSSLRGPASVGRQAAWTSPLDLAQVKDAARRRGVSVNDVLLAAVAGGLRTWLLEHGDQPQDVRAMVPVDLRAGREVSAELGNRFGVVFVPLPIGAGDAAQRVAAVHAATSEAKRSAVAPASYGLLSLVGVLPGWGQGFAASVLGRIATVIVTNVPGPRDRLTVAGAPLEGVVFWVPHIGPIGVGVSIFSYAGTVTLGVATNASLGIPALDLVAAVEAELAAL